MNTVAPFELRDLRPERAIMAREVRAGLRAKPKRVPSKYFYDARGSELFERICEQPEYYLTRDELALMRERIGEIAAAVGAGATLIEFGSGSGLKTRLLLRHLRDVAAYVPIDISETALAQSAAALRHEFPLLEVAPVCADFTALLELPRSAGRARRRVMFFPGSTIGNFETRAAAALLRRMRALVGSGGAAVIGADLKKDRALLEAAYNDRAGVTAEFTLNMLRRFNRELGADFDLAAFHHRAVYNPMAGRIETHLVSQREQVVRIDGECFGFAAGEALLTEYSYKYSIEDFSRLAAKAGFESRRVWVDAERRFSIHYLEVPQA